jgi:hypothetical protein
LSGCNYNVSYDDILGAEKEIRVKKVFKKSDGSFSFAELRENFGTKIDDEKINY